MQNHGMMCKLYERPRFQSSWLNWGGFSFFFIGRFLIPLLCVTDHDMNSLLFVFTKYKTSWHLDYFLEQLHCWRFVFLLFVPHLCGIARFLKCPCPSSSTKHHLFCKTFFLHELLCLLVQFHAKYNITGFVFSSSHKHAWWFRIYICASKLR